MTTYRVVQGSVEGGGHVSGSNRARASGSRTSITTYQSSSTGGGGSRARSGVTPGTSRRGPAAALRLPIRRRRNAKVRRVVQLTKRPSRRVVEVGR